jgi:hypothetical protein
MKQEEVDRIKMVKLQIKRAISNQKWSVAIDKRSHSRDYTTLTYLNSINEGDDMNDATIKIVVKSKFKYEDDSSAHDGRNPCRKVSISIKSNGYWRDFNGLSYGFSKLELRVLRWILKYKSIEKDKLHKEYLKQRAIRDLSAASQVYIIENKSQFRDSKLEQILEK